MFRLGRKEKCNISEFDKEQIVKCISEATGDDIRACLRREGINEKKSVGRKLMKWDFINRNFIMNFSVGDVTAEYAKRGAWYLVPLYDRKNNTLLTVMREDRLSALQKKQEKRRKAHYMDALVKSFNFDVQCSRQMSLFDAEQFDKDEISTIVSEILRDFKIEKNMVKRYATVLFEEYNSEVTGVRYCILDSSLQIVFEEDWSYLLDHSESVVVETVSNKETNKMTNLTLKRKAKDRIGQRELVAIKKNVEEQNSQSQ